MNICLRSDFQIKLHRFSGKADLKHGSSGLHLDITKAYRMEHFAHFSVAIGVETIQPAKGYCH